MTALARIIIAMLCNASITICSTALPPFLHATLRYMRGAAFILSSLLDCQSKKMSLTLFPNAFAILMSVSVVVTVIAPLSSPQIVWRDTPARSARFACDKLSSNRASLILYRTSSPPFCNLQSSTLDNTCQADFTKTLDFSSSVLYALFDNWCGEGTWK